MSGVQPAPRTCHTSSAAIGDRLFVFGGGDKGAEPVKDQQLHVFDTGTSGCAKGRFAQGWNRRFASRVHSQRVNIGSLLCSELEWMGGCSSLLMCIDLSVFAGNLRQVGGVKLWDEERCGG